MNIFSLFAQKMDDQLQALVAAGKVPEGLDASRATIELPRDPEHGDLASNMAMVLAKSAGMPPRQMAEFLVAGIQQDPSVISAEIAGPGFINLRLSAAFGKISHAKSYRLIPLMGMRCRSRRRPSI